MRRRLGASLRSSHRSSGCSSRAVAAPDSASARISALPELTYEMCCAYVYLLLARVTLNLLISNEC